MLLNFKELKTPSLTYLPGPSDVTPTVYKEWKGVEKTQIVLPGEVCEGSAPWQLPAKAPEGLQSLGEYTPLLQLL